MMPEAGVPQFKCPTQSFAGWLPRTEPFIPLELANRNDHTKIAHKLLCPSGLSTTYSWFIVFLLCGNEFGCCDSFSAQGEKVSLNWAMGWSQVEQACCCIIEQPRQQVTNTSHKFQLANTGRASHLNLKVPPDYRFLLQMAFEAREILHDEGKRVGVGKSTYTGEVYKYSSPVEQLKRSGLCK